MELADAIFAEPADLFGYIKSRWRRLADVVINDVFRSRHIHDTDVVFGGDCILKPKNRACTLGLEGELD